MLEHNGNINAADRYGRTPLHIAAAVDYADMCEFLISRGKCSTFSFCRMVIKELQRMCYLIVRAKTNVFIYILFMIII